MQLSDSLSAKNRVCVNSNTIDQIFHEIKNLFELILDKLFPRNP
jgi:hypothetical protein